MGSFSGFTSRVERIADPCQVASSIDPRPLLSGQLARPLSMLPKMPGSSHLPGAGLMGRLPGASMIQGGQALATGGLNLKDRFRLFAGDPATIAKAITAEAMMSPSTKWAPCGFLGFGPMVSNIASLTRAGIPATQIQRARLPRWF